MRPRRGFILIFTCLALVVLMAVAGIAVDVGRMYIGKNELQSFAEGAALAGALQLDGTTEGVTRATDVVANTATGSNAMKWDMATKAVRDITTTFAKGLAASPDKPDAATWTAKPDSPSNYRFVKVIASASLPSIFMQAFQGAPNSATNVVATAVAGQVSETATLGPFFAVQVGEQYSIEGDDPAALAARVQEDADPVSVDYSSYVTNAKGNGRRLVELPLKTAAGGTAIGSGEFFLLTPEVYKNARKGEPIYAEYVGSAVQNSRYGRSVRLVE